MAEMESDLVCLSSSDEEEELGKKVEEDPILEVSKEEDDHDYEVLTLESDDDDIVFVENVRKKETGKILNGGVISDGGSDDEVSVVMTIAKQPASVADSVTDKEISAVVEKQTGEVEEETKGDFEPFATGEGVVDERDEEVVVGQTWSYEDSQPIVVELGDEEEKLDDECEAVVEEPDDEEEAVQDKVQHGVIVEDVTGQLSQDEEDDETEEVDIEGDGLKVEPQPTLEKGEMTPPKKTEGMETRSQLEVECDSDVDVLEENVSISQEASSEDVDEILVLDDSTPSHDTELPVKGLPSSSSPSQLTSYEALQNLYEDFCNHNFALPQKRKRKVRTKLFKAYDEIAQSSADVHSNLVTTVEKARVAISCSEDKWGTLEKLLDYMKSQTRWGDKVVSPQKEKPHCSSRPPPSSGPSPLKSPSSSTKLSTVDREEKRNTLRMEYEKQLEEKFLEEVRALETQEVDLDEDGESVFMLQDKRIGKLMKNFYQLCDVTHSSRFTGPHNHQRFRLRKSSGYPSIDRQLERMVNAKGLLNPPDYSDVFNIVQGGASAVGLASDQVEEISERLFQSIVNHIKKLRKKELNESMVKWLPPAATPEERLILEGMDEEDQLKYYFDKDPANEDTELERKLRENAAQGRTELEVGEEFDLRAEEQSGNAEDSGEEQEGQREEDVHDFEDELSEDDEPEAKKRKVCSTDV